MFRSLQQILCQREEVRKKPLAKRGERDVQENSSVCKEKKKKKMKAILKEPKKIIDSLDMPKEAR